MLVCVAVRGGVLDDINQFILFLISLVIMSGEAQDETAIVAEAGDTMPPPEKKTKKKSKSHSVWFPGMPLNEKKEQLVAQLRERVLWSMEHGDMCRACG